MARVRGWIAATALVVTLAVEAGAQETKKEEGKPKTFFDEITWFAYVENSAVFNLRGDATAGVNELRVYDTDRGYTFNMAEVSIKKEPTERYPFGFGLSLTGGEDPQLNQALGLFRDKDDAPDDTIKFDIQEAYLRIVVIDDHAPSRALVASMGSPRAARCGPAVPDAASRARTAAIDDRRGLSGPEALGYGQIAEALSRVLGRTIAYVPVSDADYRQGVVGAGISEGYADALVDLCRYYRTGAAAAVTGDVKAVTGRDPIRFEQFARDMAGALR